MALIQYVWLASVIVSIVASTSDLPYKIPTEVIDQCLPQRAPNILDNTTWLKVNHLLDKQYGPVNCTCGGGSGNWKQVAYLDMMNASQQCPANWNLINTPVRTCAKRARASACDSTIFSTHEFTYNTVCGKVIGFRKGSTDAFDYRFPGRGLEGVYMDGVSLTHGAAGSRQHIWSFVAALKEVTAYYSCRCTNINENWPHTEPSFVGSNYFCDSGVTTSGPNDQVDHIFVNNPLWDGMGCSPTSTCCEINHPPYFCTTLAQPTTDDLEVRICSDEDTENILISSVEIYVSLN